MSKAPKVSVISITYNQEEYIKETLEGFIAQKTNFEFEVIIADDCSTDKTPEIIRQYAQEHPDIFKPILRKKNLGIQANCIDAFQTAKGDYLAFCEGDDYWSDPTKLQKQVNFLDSHQNYALCFHPVRVFFEGNEEKEYIFPEGTDIAKFTVSELLRANFIQSNSVMYRRQDYKSLPNDVMPLDWYLHLYHAQFGMIGFIDDVMSAYRRQDRGVWWNSHKDQDKLWRIQGLAQLGMFAELLKIYGDTPEFRDIIETQIIDMFNRLIAVDSKHETTKVQEALVKFPEAAETFLLRQNLSLQHESTTQQQKEVAIRRLLTDLSRSMEETVAIKHSKSFVVGYLLLHPWQVPRRLTRIALRKIRRANLVLKSRKDLNSVNDQYKKAEQIIRSHQNVHHKKTAIILHLYYTDLWDYFDDKLQNLDHKQFDLFVSVPVDQQTAAQNIIKRYPDACVIPVPNRGRDVLPFVKIISSLRGHGYQNVLKVHSKKSKHINDGNEWLTNIIDNLIPEQQRLQSDILEALDKKDTALIGPNDQYISLAVNYEANRIMLRNLVTNLKSEKVCRKVDLYRFEYGFFAGTMFWARLDAIQHIIANSSNAALYGMEQGQIDNTYAHAIERAFALIPELDGKKLYGINANKLAELDYPTNNIPSWSDVYMGPKEEE